MDVTMCRMLCVPGYYPSGHKAWYNDLTVAMEPPVQRATNMARKHKHTEIVEIHHTPEVVEIYDTTVAEVDAMEAEMLEYENPTLADVVELDPEVEADNAKRGSIVRTAYKKLYAQRAAEAGQGKVAQRSCWDWLAQQLAGECLVDSKISIERFLTVLDANGVDHSRWTNRAKGWEGRLRMTGRLALQKVVAAQGHLRTADGDELVAPAEWVAKFTN